MAGIGGTAEQAARGAARDAAPWVTRLARLGYAAKGVVYVLVGIIAVQGAWAGGGRAQGSEGAMGTLLGRPGGRAMLALVALGMAGYALWGFVRAGLDPEGHGDPKKRIATRIGYAVSGVAHVGLALAALRMTRSGQGAGGGDNADNADDWTATAMAAPMGRWLVAAAGVAIIGYGIAQLLRAWKVKVGERLELSGVDAGQREWIIRLGRFGMAARGVVFGIIGWFLIRAAMESDAGEARGLQGALRTLGEQGYGPALLGVVGLGLAAYGLFELVEARYRRIRPAE